MYKACELKIFALKSSEEFGKRVCESIRERVSECEDKNFPDKESYARPLENVRGRDIFVIQSLYNGPFEDVDKKIRKLCIFNNAAKYGSAARITSVIPYLAYARQDRKDKSRAPLSAQLLADDLMNSGANRILGMTWHSVAIQNAYRVPHDILRAGVKIMGYINEEIGDEDKIKFLAPDVGALENIIEEDAKLLRGIYERGIDSSAFAIKDRIDEETVIIKEIVGDVDGYFLIIGDDESVTGGTLVKTAEFAKKKGARKMWGYIAHNKLTEEGVRKIEDSPLERMIVTDTIYKDPEFFEKHPKFKLVSVTSLFGEAIRRIHNSESLDPLFHLI